MDKKLYCRIKKNWDKIAKPLDSMGVFEEYISRIGAINNREFPGLDKNCLLVFMADNGVVEEGISQSGQEVTGLCAVNMGMGCTSACVMAKANNVDVLPVDVGINNDDVIENVINKKVRKGTRNFAVTEAMTDEELQVAISVGETMVNYAIEQGYELAGIGELGIGNTTTSSAIAASLLKLSASEVTGRGAGLSDEGLNRKIKVIDAAIKKYDLYNKEPLQVLKSVGGYDIAAMTGACLAAAKKSFPIVLDGVISMVAALVAIRINPDVVDYIIPSHMSKEGAAKLISEELLLEPVINANMALGEGTGAVLMIGLLKTANEVYKKGCPFAQTEIEQYERF